MTIHTLQNVQHDDDGTLDIDMTWQDDRIVIDEAEVDEGRAVVIEYDGSDIILRIYSADKHNPVTVRIDQVAGIEIDRTDFDKEIGIG